LVIQSQDLFNFLTQYKGGCNPLVIQLCWDEIGTLPSIAMKFEPSDIVDVKIVLQRQILAELVDYVTTTYRYKRGYSGLVFT
jgi:hypothetical protein